LVLVRLWEAVLRLLDFKYGLPICLTAVWCSWLLWGAGASSSVVTEVEVIPASDLSEPRLAQASLGKFLHPEAGDLTLSISPDLNESNLSLIPEPERGIARLRSFVLPPGMTLDQFERDGDISKVFTLTHIKIQGAGTLDISGLQEWVFGLRSPEPIVRITIQDRDRRSATHYVTDAVPARTRYYSLSLSRLASSIDLRHIDSVSFTIDGDRRHDEGYQLVIRS
jgi:hypothetical protein